MSSKSEAGNGFVRIKDRIPYHGKGVDELVGALRKALSEPANKFTQKIVLEVGAPHIYLEKLVPEGEAMDVPQLSLHDAIRTQKMDEYEPTADRSPIQQLWEIFGMVHDEGFEVTDIVVGNKNRFQKWLSIRLPPTKMTFFETPVHVVGELPEDVFVVCGAPTKGADVDEIKYSVKGTI
jgi:hypothetical protein